MNNLRFRHLSRHVREIPAPDDAKGGKRFFYLCPAGRGESLVVLPWMAEEIDPIRNKPLAEITSALKQKWQHLEAGTIEATVKGLLKNMTEEDGTIVPVVATTNTMARIGTNLAHGPVYQRIDSAGRRFSYFPRDMLLALKQWKDENSHPYEAVVEKLKKDHKINIDITVLRTQMAALTANADAKAKPPATDAPPEPAPAPATIIHFVKPLTLDELKKLLRLHPFSADYQRAMLAVTQRVKKDKDLRSDPVIAHHLARFTGANPHQLPTPATIVEQLWKYRVAHARIRPGAPLQEPDPVRCVNMARYGKDRTSNLLQAA